MWWDSLLSSFGFYKKKANILLIGLDNSGKSSIINAIRPDKIPQNEIVPTVGFSVSSFAKDRINFTVFDMSGQGKYRDLWEHYFQDADAIIFVIDSSDHMRCAVARDELEVLIKHPAIVNKRVPILFLANKMDLDGSMTPTEATHVLGLEAIKEQSWYICATNALTGEGLPNGMDWLADAITKLP